MARNFVAASLQYLGFNGAVVADEPFTMACWFNVVNITANMTLMNLGATAANFSHSLLAMGGTVGDPVGARSTTGPVSDAITTSGYSASTWHHATGVWAADAERYAYLDGGSKGSNAVERIVAVDYTAIGTYTYNGGHGWYVDGIVAEAAIWNVALTDAEVAILAKGYSPRFVRPESLVAYWPLIRTDNDRVGGYHMTPYNTPTWADHPPIIMPAPPMFYSIPSAAGGPTYTLTAEDAISVGESELVDPLALGMAVTPSAAYRRRVKLLG